METGQVILNLQHFLLHFFFHSKKGKNLITRRPFWAFCNNQIPVRARFQKFQKLATSCFVYLFMFCGLWILTAFVGIIKNEKIRNSSQQQV